MNKLAVRIHKMRVIKYFDQIHKSDCLADLKDASAAELFCFLALVLAAGPHRVGAEALAAKPL